MGCEEDSVFALTFVAEDRSGLVRGLIHADEDLEGSGLFLSHTPAQLDMHWTVFYDVVIEIRQVTQSDGVGDYVQLASGSCPIPCVCIRDSGVLLLTLIFVAYIGYHSHRSDWLLAGI